MTAYSQIYYSLLDSLSLCMFVWGPGSLYTYRELEDLVRFATGWNDDHVGAHEDRRAADSHDARMPTRAGDSRKSMMSCPSDCSSLSRTARARAAMWSLNLFYE